MSIIMFRIKFELLKDFSKRLKKEDVPIPIQKAMIKHYAIDLKLTLTDSMTHELVIY
ncbi:hypothetical protein HNQ80_002746 [Anaerosolibacter carboniphilus]|uniref:Uncharacterized protein n=1 Tax=Anaerosolibacter carboniphilus TaxID=1417629 RepID=A0A841L0E5_9FIRM|nr:hypothetical protein [Anaerosolibacter carboniphilus]MBB6216642.1 hypothetical protein [Anaerosolibacter carboniphilus]